MTIIKRLDEVDPIEVIEDSEKFQNVRFMIMNENNEKYAEVFGGEIKFYPVQKGLLQ